MAAGLIWPCRWHGTPREQEVASVTTRQAVHSTQAPGSFGGPVKKQLHLPASRPCPRAGHAFALDINRPFGFEQCPPIAATPGSCGDQSVSQLPNPAGRLSCHANDASLPVSSGDTRASCIMQRAVFAMPVLVLLQAQQGAPHGAAPQAPSSFTYASAWASASVKWRAQVAVTAPMPNGTRARCKSLEDLRWSYCSTKQPNPGPCGEIFVIASEPAKCPGPLEYPADDRSYGRRLRRLGSRGPCRRKQRPLSSRRRCPRLLEAR